MGADWMTVMSGETISKQSGRGLSRLAVVLAGLMAVVTILPISSLLAAGGDNDSPYNMPSRDGAGGGGGGTAAANDGSDGSQTLTFLMSPEGHVVQQYTDPHKAVLSVPACETILEWGPYGLPDHLIGLGYPLPDGLEAGRIVLRVADGERVNLESQAERALVQGGFRISGGGAMELLPTNQPGLKLAFLLIGSSESGTTLDTVHFVTQIALPEGSGIKLSEIAGRLAGKPGLRGTTASVVLVRVNPSGTPASIEATATFNVGPNFSARIDIDDA
ncbi:MAG: hypothetical protein V2A76_14085 [Planctomycetota bacterium]